MTSLLSTLWSDCYGFTRSATALLFLQLIMRKLRRKGSLRDRASRAAVVVPNGILYGDGVAARVKAELLSDFNLHTILRLPNGAFAPYTPIPTNILFFDRSGPTHEIWYFDHALPEGRKNHTKTAPIQSDHFNACRAWWHDRRETDQAWSVRATDVAANGFNLDCRNPRTARSQSAGSPLDMSAQIAETQRVVDRLMRELTSDIAELLQ